MGDGSGFFAASRVVRILIWFIIDDPSLFRFAPPSQLSFDLTGNTHTHIVSMPFTRSYFLLAVGISFSLVVSLIAISYEGWIILCALSHCNAESTRRRFSLSFSSFSSFSFSLRTQPPMFSTTNLSPFFFFLFFCSRTCSSQASCNSRNITLYRERNLITCFTTHHLPCNSKSSFVFLAGEPYAACFRLRASTNWQTSNSICKMS